MQDKIMTYARVGSEEQAAPMDKYALYLRKSREDRNKEKDGEEDTLKRHREILLQYAAKKGLYVEKMYEEVVSGETIKDRPQIQKLIEDCYAGRYRGILVVEVTRLSRGNQGDAQTILDCLRFGNNNKGLLVHTPTKVYDVVHSHEDEEFMEFELFMSRREFKMINRRLDRGRKQAVMEGNYMGSYRPYGYDIVTTRTTRTLKPNEDEAPFVKLAFEWTVKDNMTPGQIARRLTDMGVPTYTGAPEWSESTLRAILCNPTYTGKVRWNDRMQVKRMVDGELVTSRPRSNHTDQYMLYEGKHPGLVDEETFKAASSRFHSDKTKSTLILTNPLAGVLVCQKCGRVMTYQTYKGRNTPPRFSHPHSRLCKVKSVVAKDVMEAFIHACKLYIEDLQVKVDSTPAEGEAQTAEVLAALKSELKKLEKRMTKLFEAWEDETISNNEFVERKTVNADKMESIRNQIEELEEEIPSKEESKEKIMLLHDILDTVMDESIPAVERNRFVKAIIRRIEFSRENTEEFIIDVYLH